MLCFDFREAYKINKIEPPPFLYEDEQGIPQNESQPLAVPDEFACRICKEFCVDAVLSPCCAEHFCDECELTYSNLEKYGVILE